MGSFGAMASAFQLVSPSFGSGDPIPVQHTCEGENTSPPLTWRSVPEGTRTLALVVDDPDAAGRAFVHWVLFNVPSETDSIPAGVQLDVQFRGARQMPVEGGNDFGDTGYGGPCPPPGRPHRYIFRIYALDTVLDLGAGATKQQLTDDMTGHILAEANLIGTYARSG